VEAKAHPILAGLLAALLAWPLAAFASTSLHLDAEPDSTRAAAFDATLLKVTGPASLDSSREAYDADLERLRALLPAGDPAREAKFRSVYCGSSRWKDPEQALAYSDAALVRARDARDLASEARAILCRANYIMLASGSQRGMPDVEKAIALLRDTQEQQLLAEALETRGDLHSLLGEQAKAMLDFQQARAAYRGSGIDHEVEPLMLSIAVAYRRMGDWPQARRHFTAAVARMQDKGDWESVATNLIQLGFLHGESGAPEKALASFREAETVAVAHKDAYSANAARLGIAESQISLGQPDAALATLQLARAGFAADHDASSDDMLLMLTGQALARQGQHAEALARYRQALPLIEKDGNERYLAMLYKAQAASREALGEAAGALADYKRYNDLQSRLQGKMRLEQGRLLEYEYEIRRRDFENRQLRAQAAAKQQEVAGLETVRRWQSLAIALAVLLACLLASLALRHWRTSRRLTDLSLLDALTGIANRPGIEREAARALEVATRDGSPLSLLMLDLDHFKAINDRYGHAAGDKVLRAIAASWQAQLRGRDPIGRVGGEEFVVVCPGTALAQALAVAERLREAATALRFDDIDPALRVSVSIGAAQARRVGDSCDALIDRADAALYRAKQQGRDRVVGSAGRSSAAPSSSPVRIRTTRSRSHTKILPSPILPVPAALMIASLTASTWSSVTATSSLILGRKSTTYSAPRYSSVWPFWRPKPLTSVAVMPATPASASASRTSSSLNGLMIAMTIFIARPPSASFPGPAAAWRQHTAAPVHTRRAPEAADWGIPHPPMHPAPTVPAPAPGDAGTVAAGTPRHEQRTHDRPRPARRTRPPPQQPGAARPARGARGTAAELQVGAAGRAGQARPRHPRGVRGPARGAGAHPREAGGARARPRRARGRARGPRHPHAAPALTPPPWALRSCTAVRGWACTRPKSASKSTWRAACRR
jgi:diguanylate cyclase (GGDEF)-like protein